MAHQGSPLSSSSSDTSAPEVEGNLDSPFQIRSLHFTHCTGTMPNTLSVFFWRREGNMWGNHETATHPGQRLSLELIMECVQRTYIYWYDWVPHTDEEFENDIKSCLCAEDIMIDYDMFNPIRRLAIRANHGQSLQECNSKLKLRRKYYTPGLYHCTFMFQMKPGDNHIIALEFLARKSQETTLPPPLDDLDEEAMQFPFHNCL